MPYRCENSKYSTICGDCLFAKFKKETKFLKNNFLEQDGCKLNRDKEMAKQGAKITQHTDNRVGVNSYEIDRICSAFRPVGQRWSGENKTEAEQLKQVRKEIELRLDFVVLFSPNDTVEKLNNTLASILKQSMQPNQIFVVDTQTTTRPSTLINILQKTFQHFPNWKYTKINECNKVTEGQSVDETTSLMKGQYYTLMKCDQQIPENYIKNIDIALNDKCERFLLLKSKDGTKTFQTTAHKSKIILANSPMIEENTETGEKKTLNSLEEKLEAMSKDENSEYLIRNYEDISNYHMLQS